MTPSLRHLAARIRARLDRDGDALAYHGFLAQRESSAAMAMLQQVGLTSEAIDVLIALTLPAIDGEIAAAWARAGCTARPTIGELIPVLACEDEEALRAALAPGSPLIELGLLTLGGGDHTPHDQRDARVDDRVVGFLHGDTALDRRLAAIATLHRKPGPCDVTAARRIARALESTGPIVVEGSAGVGKVAAAVAAITLQAGESNRLACTAAPEAGEVAAVIAAISGRSGEARTNVAATLRSALVCDVGALLASDDPHGCITALRRDALFAGARIVLRVAGWEAAWPASTRRALIDLIDAGAILAIRDASGIVRELRGARRIQVAMPTPTEQAAMWCALLGEIEGIEHVCARYPLPPGDIAVATAELRAETELAGRSPTIEDVLVAARVQLRHRLGDVAELVSTRLGWTDVVLRDDVAAKVRELMDAVRLRDRVLIDWGFDAKLPYGRAISALLSGPPGTGKTMVATILGKELGLEVFRVDLSKVVSKYIGETEKNLARVFEEASRCRAIILFDEADSLFSKRTEIKSSNDRFANQEVNFLLQRLENHDGVVILTTNAATAIDRAFLRRIRYRIEFSEPDASERARLWRSMIPVEAPLADDVDFDALGRRFAMTGGHIKNAVVRAAYLAITDGRAAIDQDTLLRSALSEWTELGNLTPPEGPAEPVLARGSALAIPTIKPMFSKPAPTPTTTTEATLIKILTSPPAPGYTIDADYRRKEHEIGQVFASLSSAQARELHRRLTLGTTDLLSVQFARLSRDRRDRLMTFLADARRREAMGARRAYG